MKIDYQFERIYDYRFEMIFRKLTIIWHALGVRGFLPIEFLTKFNRQEPTLKKQLVDNFKMINDRLFERSDSDLFHFEIIYPLSFRNDGDKNFRTQNCFRQQCWLKTS